MNRSRSRFRPYRSSISFRSRGKSKAANNQRDTTTVVIKTNCSFACGQTYYNIDPYVSGDVRLVDPVQNIYEIIEDKAEIKSNWIDSGCCAINIYDILRKSEMYNVYSAMYDQFKIDNVRAKIIATNWVNNSKEKVDDSLSEYVGGKSYIIVTAWDRNGLNEDQIRYNILPGSYEWNHPQGNYITLIDGRNYPTYDNAKKRRIWTTIGKKILSYSSAMTKHLGPGNAYEIVRQLYPQTIIEKDQYLSCKSLIPQYVRVTDGGYPYLLWRNVVPNNIENISERPIQSYNPAINNSYTLNYEIEKPTPEVFEWDSKNPCNLLQDPAVPFKPTLLVNVVSGPEPQVVAVENNDIDGFNSIYEIGINKIQPVTFDIEFSITVTFRGTRYNKYIT